MAMYRSYKKRLDRLLVRVGSPPPKPSAAESAASEAIYNEFCYLFLTRYNVNISIPKEVCERLPPDAAPPHQYFLKLWRVLDPFPEAKALVHKHLRNCLARREAARRSL